MLHLAHDLDIPIDAITQPFGILANRGAGKSYCASVFAEEFLKANLPVVIIDPLGAWFGLRIAPDGVGEGFPITIFGGDHADVPITDDMGDQIASLIAQHGFSALIDLSHFRKAGQNRFMLAFAETLYHENRNALHLIVDEADLYAPQRPQKGQERLLGAMEDIIRRGRFKGLGITLITQRAAVLNKNLLELIGTLIVLRTVGPRDRQALDEWIKVFGEPEQREEFMASLPKLPVGRAWFWSPGWLGIFQQVQIRQRETFDSSRTPKVGERITQPELKTVDVAWLMEALDVKPVPDDKAALQRRIDELESQLAAITQPQFIEVQVPIFNDLAIAVLQDIQQRLQDFMEGTDGPDGEPAPTHIIAPRVYPQEGVTTVTMPDTIDYSMRDKPSGQFALRQNVRADDFVEGIVPPLGSGGGEFQYELGNTLRQNGRAEMVEFNLSDLMSGDAEFQYAKKGSKAAEKMFETLLSYYPGTLTRGRWALLSGYSTTSSGVDSAIRELKERDMIGVSGKNYRVSDAAAALVQKPKPKTPDEIQKMWFDVLEPAPSNVLAALLEVYPQWIGKQAISDRTGYSMTSSGLSGAITYLKKHDLIVQEGSVWKAAKELME